MNQSQSVYILDSYSADRFRSILQQIVEVFDEILDHRSFELRDKFSFGMEEVDLGANVANLRQEELDELF